MQDQPQGHGGPRALGEFTQRLTRVSLARRGFTEATLIAEWPQIVGLAQSNGSLPLKISFPTGARNGGIVHVRVATGGLATEFRHREPLILQRINGYFGYNAVKGLRLTQGPVPAAPSRRQAPARQPVDAAREQQLTTRLAVVQDDDLRAALAQLGRTLRPNLAGEG